MSLLYSDSFLFRLFNKLLPSCRHLGEKQHWGQWPSVTFACPFMTSVFVSLYREPIECSWQTETVGFPAVTQQIYDLRVRRVTPQSWLFSDSLLALVHMISFIILYIQYLLLCIRLCFKKWQLVATALKRKTANSNNNNTFILNIIYLILNIAA